MKILVNSSILRAGGGIQKTAEIFESIIRYGDEHDWMIMLSPQVAANIKIPDNMNNIRKRIIPIPPGRLITGRGSRKMMAEMEREFNPDVVFTIFGPAYIKFKSPHLMGFAVRWVTHPSKLAWSSLEGLRKRVSMYLWCRMFSIGQNMLTDGCLNQE